MSWLHALIHSLNHDELSKIQDLRVIGKERAVLQSYLKAYQTAAPEPSTICIHAEISENHFYKINSVLISKILAAIEPSGGYNLLQWLRSKELYSILKNELKNQLKVKLAAEEYLKMFRLMIDLPYKHYDEALSKLIGQKYLDVLKGCTESDRMYIRFHLLFADCNRFAAARNPEKKFRFSEEDLLAFESEIGGKENYLALYYLYRTLCNYYNYYRGDAEKSLKYLEKAISLKDKIASFFPIPIEQFLRLLYADALLGFGSVEEAYQTYKELFSSGVDKEMYGYYFHCEQYIISSILLRKYAQSEDLLHVFFDACIAQSTDIYATRGVLTYAKLYLSIGELKKAQSYINNGIQMNEKTFYLPFELQLRVLENIYFFFKNDLEFAKQLAQRNLKFVLNQKSKEIVPNYRLVFKLINTLINCKEHRKQLTNNQIQDLKFVRDRFLNVYCELFEKMHLSLTKS